MTAHKNQIGATNVRELRETKRKLSLPLSRLGCLLAGFAAIAAHAATLPPSAEKEFDPGYMYVGGINQMTITLHNNNAGATLTGVKFTDSYPGGLFNAQSGAIVANTCNGTLTADPNGTFVALINGSIPPSNVCKVVLNVTATQAAGQSLTNHTGPISATGTLAGADATADLTVASAPLLAPPIATMTALPGSIDVDGFATMMITLSNPNVTPIVGVQLAVNYPAPPLHIVNAPTDVLQDENSCSNGHDVATPGGSGVSIAGATIPSGSTCVYFLSVVGTTPGNSDLHTGPILSANANVGADATTTLTVAGDALLPALTLQEAITPASIKIGGTAQILITLTNNDPTTDATGVHLVGVYAPGMTNAPNALVSNTCSGLPIFHPHNGMYANDFVLLGGTVPAGGTCNVAINVVGSIGGGVTPTSFLHNDTNANAQSGGSATASVAVVDGALLDAPIANKAFAPPSIAIGDTSEMTIQLTNTNQFLPITGAQFTDSYPDGIANVSNGTIVSENTCGGTVTAEFDGKSAALANGTIPPAGCKVVVNVVGTSGGLWVNQTGAIPSGNALVGNTAFGGLFVDDGVAPLAAPTVSKAFAPQSVAVGDVAEMTITIRNLDATRAITGAQFTDPYPGGMANASSAVLVSNDCNGTVTAPQNGQSLALSGGTIAPASGCSIVARVVGTTPGTLLNETTPVTSSNATPSTSASATLTVDPPAGGLAQTITFTSTAPANATVGGSTYLATATATSNLPVSLTVDATSATICTINSGMVTFIGAGTCTIDANQGGNATYAAAAQVQQPFAVTAAGGAAQQTIAFTSAVPLNATAGGPPYLATATATSNLPVSLTIDAVSGSVCTINNGLVSFVAAGTCTIDANQGGDATYAPAVQMQQSFPVAAAGGATSQTIAFTSVVPINASVGGPTYLAAATATSNLPVVLTIDAVSSAVCTINSGTVSFIGSGTCTIDANQGGNASYAPAAQVQQSIAVSAGGGASLQTIAFTSAAPANAKVGGATYVAIAVATSNLPVTLTVAFASDTVCAINNGLVSFIGVGMCTIDANQGGNANYAPAPQAQQSFAVAASGGGTPQAITFTSTTPANATVGGAGYLAIASATSGLGVTLTIDAPSDTTCTINNGQVTFIGAGTCTIDANQGGNATYAAAPQMQQSFAVAAAGGATSQTITFTSIAPGNAIVGATPYLASATATSGLPVSLAIDAASNMVCAITNGLVSFIGAGTCTINANQGGNATYAAAPQVLQSFAVAAAGGAAAQMITFISAAPNNAKVLGLAYQVIATSTSGLAVVLVIDGSSATVCTIDNDTVSFIGAGTCTIDANQGGNAAYAPASQMQQSFGVASAGGVTVQTISFASTAPNNAKVFGPVYQASATASSGLPVVLTVEASSALVCTINAGTVNFIGAGTCAIDANQGGDATYAAAPEAQQSFAVSSAGGLTVQTIAFASTAPNNAEVGGATYHASATASSGLPVVLTIDGTSALVCAINNGMVTLIGVGICTVDANQGGDATYAAATQKQQSFAVASAGGITPQTITFTSSAPANATVGGFTYHATATATSNLPVVLTIAGTSSTVCTINYGTVSFIGAGTCTIDANQGGSATYAAAPQKQQVFAVGNGGGSGNTAPIAVGDAIEVTPNGQTSALVGDVHVPSSVLDNDLDQDGDTLTAIKLSNPTHGTLVQFTPDGTFVYQTNVNAGTDSFTYHACDTHNACSGITTVTLTIGVGLNDHVPFAVDDATQISPGGTSSGIIGDLQNPNSVLDNDIDPDGDLLVASKLSNPAHGSIVFNSNGTFTYQNDGLDPAITSDAFMYQACDIHGACDLGVVTMTIGNNPIDHAPIVVDDAIQVTPNAPGNSTNVLIGDLNVPSSVLDNDVDVDAGDSLTTGKIGGLLNASGTMALNVDGTFTYQNTDPSATSDMLLYQACDQMKACTAGVITISITDGPMDQLPIAMDDAIDVAPHGSTSAVVGDATVPNSVLDNDHDPDNQALVAHLISAPANGHVMLNSAGTFTYFNDDPSTGLDSWQYEACDPNGACVAATVSVTINAAAPTITCTLPTQVDSVGDAISIDLSSLFAPPAGQALTYSGGNLPPSLSILGSLLTGTLQTSDLPNSPYLSVLKATTAPGGVSASENVIFQVLPTGEILLRNGFEDSSQSSACP